MRVRDSDRLNRFSHGTTIQKKRLLSDPLVGYGTIFGEAVLLASSFLSAVVLIAVLRLSLYTQCVGKS